MPGCAIPGSYDEGQGEGNVCRRFIRVVLGEVESERNDRPIEKEDVLFYLFSPWKCAILLNREIDFSPTVQNVHLLKQKGEKRLIRFSQFLD